MDKEAVWLIESPTYLKPRHLYTPRRYVAHSIDVYRPAIAIHSQQPSATASARYYLPYTSKRNSVKHYPTRRSHTRRKARDTQAWASLVKQKTSLAENSWPTSPYASCVHCSSVNHRCRYSWMYITSLQSYFSQINSRQTSFEACFDSKRKSRDCSAP